MELTPNKSQHRKLTVEKIILSPLLPGFELGTFRSRVRRSTNKLSWDPGSDSSLCKVCLWPVLIFLFNELPLILCPEVVIHVLLHSDITYAVDQMFETIYLSIYPHSLSGSLAMQGR